MFRLGAAQGFSDTLAIADAGHDLDDYAYDQFGQRCQRGTFLRVQHYPAEGSRSGYATAGFTGRAGFAVGVLRARCSLGFPRR